MRWFIASLAACLSGSVSGEPIATGGGFSLDRSVLAAGGGLSTGGDFEIQGTLGQSEAGEAAAGGPFSITGGFWVEARIADLLFSDDFEGDVR